MNTKRLNTVQAIWARNKNEIKEEEYNEFYTFVAHDHDKPLFRLHFSADAPLAIQALLFVPQKNFETMGMGRIESEVNLYCRKVLIQAKAKGLAEPHLVEALAHTSGPAIGCGVMSPYEQVRESMANSPRISKFSILRGGWSQKSGGWFSDWRDEKRSSPSSRRTSANGFIHCSGRKRRGR